MRVLIAPQRYAALLPAAQVADAIALGWALGAPHDEITCLPLSDGGPGFLDVVALAHPDLEELAVTATDPWGRDVPAQILLGGGTAYLEASQVCGAHLRRPDDRVLGTTTRGIGTLLQTARDTGAARIVIGITGCLPIDAGAGLLAEVGDLATVRSAWGAVPIDVLGDLHQPLLGLQGAAATGLADRAEAQDVERVIGERVDLLSRRVPAAADLLSGQPIRWERQPGAGAGGGLGFGLLLLGARPVDGAAGGPEIVGLPHALASADLLVTGTSSLDWEALRGSCLTAAAALAQGRGLPAVAISGQVSAGRRELLAAGINGSYAIVDSPSRWSTLEQDTAARVATRAEAVARTWSPTPV